MSWKALPVVLFLCTCCVFHDARATVVADVTVISPERVAPLEHAYVRIENGRIEEVSTRPVKGTPQIDAGASS